MSTLLSVILCVAMLLGGGTVEDVPTTQTVLDVREICVSGSDQSVEVEPNLRLTFALGAENVDLTAEIPNGEAKAALRFLPDGTLLWTGSERTFKANAAALSAITEGWTEEALPSAPMGTLLDRFAAQLLADRKTEDFFWRFMDALGAATGAEIETEDAFVCSDGQTVAAKSLFTDVSYEMLLNALDGLRGSGGASAELLQAYLNGTIKPDGTPYSRFIDTMNGESDELLHVCLACGRDDGMIYNQLGFDPISDADGTGTFTLETFTREGESMKIVLSAALYDDRNFTYDAVLDLQGTPEDIRSLSVTADMSNERMLSYTTTEADERGMATADVESLQLSRHFELNAVRTDGLWNAACNVSWERTHTGEEPAQAELSVGYSEALDEDEAVNGLVDAVYATENKAVIGTVDAVYSDGERDFDLLFDVARSEEEYADALKDLAVMEMSSLTNDVPTMVFGLDLQSLKTRLISVLTEESVSDALGLMGIDASTIFQPKASKESEESAEESVEESAEEFSEEEAEEPYQQL